MDIQLLYTLIGVLGGLLGGGALVWLSIHQRIQQQELELRELSSQLAVANEKLEQSVYWRAECEQLNQELRAQREINNVQES
ncbi:hypothetical protein O185_10655 [Photorhabdus temperata J3]|nr:hypothetical protein O185_10655 [Photorhabdus temperata J3]